MSTHLPCIRNGAPRPMRNLSGGLMKRVFALLLLGVTGLDAVQASVPVPAHLISPDTPRIEDPDSLIHRFLQAVDRGELKAFGQTLTRSMIVPARVEYVYELSSRTTWIKIYSSLKTPLPVPGQRDCQILGVSAILEDGNIIEVESHVWMTP